MRWSAVWWLAFVAATAILQEAYVRAAPNPQPEDMWKTLLELDRMYSSIARPSVVFVCVIFHGLVVISYCSIGTRASSNTHEYYNIYSCNQKTISDFLPK
ncbi:hypothetical protein RI129_000366 [Pyrocoelia pectoralis]|uniref:Uncharacterized protein n=1 Tax=Pyrocoelia pectoralis TaxID=417401 RepID=A0AAN7ZQA5_9COLE